MHQGLEDVPALLSGGGDDGTHSGEVVGTPPGAEATGDLLAQLGHSEVTFGLIVRKRRARVGEESQASLLVLAEAEREVMTDAAFLSSALAGPERRLRLVEGDGVVEERAQARGIRATREAGTSRPFSRAKRVALCARSRRRCMLFAQSSFSMSIRAWSSRR